MSDERTDDRAAAVGDERLAGIEELPLDERAPHYAAIADELRDVLEGADPSGA